MSLSFLHIDIMDISTLAVQVKHLLTLSQAFPLFISSPAGKDQTDDHLFELTLVSEVVNMLSSFTLMSFEAYLAKQL